MHISNRQKAQKSTISLCWKTIAAEKQALPMRMTPISMKLAVSWVCLLVYREKRDDPAIMAHMKELKIRPNGRSPSALVREDLRAADQKKIMRYMDPSRKHDARPSESTFLLERRTWKPDRRSARKLCSADLVP